MRDGHAHERRAHGAAERARGLDQGGCDAHILPGMDDGSKSVEMSIEMLHRLAEMGVNDPNVTAYWMEWQEVPRK